ncbi:uncharacterized protein LOC5508781 [Nematostella vectensis]|uniref:uncharacterized protein LOC5508781 n=1 Tax=Nematostella vectensis TaxID=45351 RepID=UPI0020775E29|nr:uncharacterized protein LOC5508781 [Nematostella vectensis]
MAVGPSRKYGLTSKVTCTLVITMATALYVYYMCGRMTEEQFRSMNLPKIQAYIQHKCSPVLDRATRGAWKLKPHVTTADLDARRRLDMMLRTRKGWPQYLSHGDLRCGVHFPLPRPSFGKNKTMVFDIQGQCDPYSEAPCCHGYKGWCGAGAAYCECQGCVDYRAFIPAELGDWVTLDKCHITNYTQNSACSLVNNRFSYITFMGDSLVRHLFSALLLILTRDRTYGALKFSARFKQKDMCRGDNQFVDSMCHALTAMRWTDISKHPTFCPERKQSFKMDFVEAYNINHAKIALTFAKRMLYRRGSVILIGVGIHNGFNAPLVIEKYFGPILRLLQHSRATTGWPRLIWLSPHAAGPLKPLTYQRHQGNHAIQAFNAQMWQYCEEQNVTVFDTYNLTLGAQSFDGTHYGVGVNLLKAQLLLNYWNESR